MLDTIFREYDIRGKVGSELIIEDVYDLARAIAFYFSQKKVTVKTVAVGMDGRLHSPAIKEMVCKALLDSGLDVVFIGVCPSPVLYFALHTLSVDAGLMITASHNPKEYNGLKLCLGHQSVWGLQVKDIRELFKAKAHIVATTQGALTEFSLIDTYVTWLADHFSHLKNMHLSAVVDCGNGAAGTVMPLLVKKMGWSNVRLLYEEVDGTYPNHEADPVKEKNMADVKNVLMETDIELGIGLDGDADRMAPMSKSGYLVPGDKMLALFAQHVLQDYPGASVVLDIKSSSALIELMQQWGARPCLSPSGHAIIKDQMRQYQSVLGGELSCHFFFNDRYFGYDDGIYAMLRLMEIVIYTGKTLDELLTQFPTRYSTSEIHLACAEDQKKVIVEDIKKIFASRSDMTMITIDGVRVTMADSWGIIRASNTQPMLSLRFESESLQGLERIKHEFCDVLELYFEPALLRQITC